MLALGPVLYDVYHTMKFCPSFLNLRSTSHTIISVVSEIVVGSQL